MHDKETQNSSMLITFQTLIIYDYTLNIYDYHLFQPKLNGFCRYIFTKKVTLWAASYSASVVYTETIIHLSVGESGGYLPRRFAAR